MSRRVALARAWDRFTVGPLGPHRTASSITRETALTSALDASVQAQILNRFCDLRANLGLTVLSIAHNLGVVRHVCDRVAVMYLAEIVEIGPVDAVFEDSTHPYTRALLSSVPRTKTARREEPLATLTGDVPSPRDPPRGCRFYRRCPEARAACRAETPQAYDVGTDRRARCLRADSTHSYWESDPIGENPAVDD